MWSQSSQVFSLAKDSTPCFWRLRRPSCHTILSSVKLILQNQIKRLHLLVWKSSSLTPCMYFLVGQQVSTISDSSGRRTMYRCLQSWRRGQQCTQKAHRPTIPSIQQTSNSLPTLPSQVFFTHFEFTLTSYYVLHTLTSANSSSLRKPVREVLSQLMFESWRKQVAELSWLGQAWGRCTMMHSCAHHRGAFLNLHLPCFLFSSISIRRSRRRSSRAFFWRCRFLFSMSSVGWWGGQEADPGQPGN